MTWCLSGRWYRDANPVPINLKASISIHYTTKNEIGKTSPTAKPERKKDMFYLTTHSTHLFMVIWRRTFGKGPLTERGNPLSLHVLLFPINSTSSFISE